MLWSLRSVVWYTETRQCYGLLGQLFVMEKLVGVIVFKSQLFHMEKL